MAQTLTITSQITRIPGLLGGQPTVNGKRIAVATLVDLYLNQNTPVEEIVEMLPVTPGEVHAALSYYYDNPAEIEAILEQEDAILEESFDEARHKKLEARARQLSRNKSDAIARALAGSDEEMTISAIAEQYHLAPATVRRSVLNGWIAGRKSGATWLIKRSEAERRWGARLTTTPRKAGRPRQSATR